MVANAHNRAPRLTHVQTITDRPARVGKLKIGELVDYTKRDGSVGQRPQKLDYIKAVDGAGERVSAFHTKYGDRPTSFLAVFPSNDPTDWHWEAFRRYAGRGLLACHGNGREAVVEDSGETIACPCHFAEGDPPACKPVVSLSLFLFEVAALGVFQIDSGSLNSIRNIRWFLHALSGLTGGRYVGVPFRGKVEPFIATHDGKSSTAYAWKFDILEGMAPADVKIAAAAAVDSFLLPADLAGQRLIDEAQPADLYAALPAPAADQAPDDLPADVATLEADYQAALESSTYAPAKITARLAAMLEHRTEAQAAGDWPRYAEWLARSTEVARESRAA